jgi:hypothetical protein
MTQAQYHRSLAAQYQSKAGDQWGFFQAKRIRGSALENAADHLPPTASVDPARLKASAHRVTVALEQAAKNGHESDAVAKRITSEAKESESALSQELDKPEVAGVFVYLTTTKQADVEEHAIEDQALKDAVNAIKERKSDAEINLLVTRVPDKVLVTALATAESDAQAFDEASKPIGKVIDSLGERVRLHTALADASVSETPAALSDAAEAAAKERDAVVASEMRIGRAAQKLHESFAAARDRYNANRYRREADYNQKIAYLLEVQVHKSGVNSDRHRERSLHFFFGMLGAQAGVAISSMALAARMKSVLWGLAGLVGLAALAFSGYVYLYY